MLASSVLGHTRGILGNSLLRMKEGLSCWVDFPLSLCRWNLPVHSLRMCSTLHLAACFVPLRQCCLTFPVVQDTGPRILISLKRKLRLRDSKGLAWNQVTWV